MKIFGMQFDSCLAHTNKIGLYLVQNIHHNKNGSVLISSYNLFKTLFTHLHSYELIWTSEKRMICALPVIYILLQDHFDKNEIKKTL